MDAFIRWGGGLGDVGELRERSREAKNDQDESVKELEGTSPEPGLTGASQKSGEANSTD